MLFNYLIKIIGRNHTNVSGHLFVFLFLIIISSGGYAQKIDTIFIGDNHLMLAKKNKDGVLNGSYTIYNEWEDKIEEGNYVKGKKEGKVFIYTYYNGIECLDCYDSKIYEDYSKYNIVIRQTLTFKNGVEEGETWFQIGDFNFKDKFESEGDLCYGYYKNGKKNGEWTIHNLVNEKSSYGESILKVKFDNGKIIPPAIIDREANFNGLILPYPSFLDSVSVREKYGSKVYAIGHIHYGKKTGIWKYYTAGGEVKKEIQYNAKGKIIKETKFQTTAMVINDMKLDRIKFLDVNYDSTHLLLGGKGNRGELKFWIFNLRDLSLIKSGKIMAENTSGMNFYGGDENYLCLYNYITELSSILDINSMEIIETTDSGCEKFYDIFYNIKNDLSNYFNYKSIDQIGIEEPEWTNYQKINSLLHSIIIKNKSTDSEFISHINLKNGNIEFKDFTSNKDFDKIQQEIINTRESFLNSQLKDSLEKYSISNINFYNAEYFSIKNNRQLFNFNEFKETEFDIFDQYTLLGGAKESKFIKFAYENKVVYYDYNESNGNLVFWNGNIVEKNKRSVRLNIKKDKSYIFYCKDLYYMFKGNISNDLFFEQDLKLFPFEQFDLKFNRPDIILKRLGYADSALIASYYLAYQKRLKRMNFSEEMLQTDFHLPEIKIKNIKTLPVTTQDSIIKIDLSLKDTKYLLDRINVFINNVPIFGTVGIDLRKENTQDLDKTLNLALTCGENKIQASVLNQAGIESFKETVYITCNSKKTVLPNLYLISIGDSKYKDARYDLTYASKDASDIATTFQNSSLFEKTNIFTYTDEKVTRENILNLKEELKKAKRDDVVIITVAGHGVLDDKLDYYIATHDMDFSNPSEKGIPYEELESLLDGIDPLKKVLFLDACHSGEVDKEEVEQIALNTSTTGTVKFRNAGSGIQKKNLGLKTTSELMGELFTDLRRGTGATVVSSAGGAEFAMESDEWKNGLFTYCLLHGLKDKAADINNDGQIMLSELQIYLRKEVTLLSKGAQQPTSRIENLSMDFRIW